MFYNSVGFLIFIMLYTICTYINTQFSVKPYILSLEKLNIINKLRTFNYN